MIIIFIGPFWLGITYQVQQGIAIHMQQQVEEGICDWTAVTPLRGTN